MKAAGASWFEKGAGGLLGIRYFVCFRVELRYAIDDEIGAVENASNKENDTCKIRINVQRSLQGAGSRDRARNRQAVA